MTAVITGASSGIGAATALALHARDVGLVLSGRNEGRLAAVAGKCGGARYVVGDVEDPSLAEMLFAELPPGPVGAVFAAGNAKFGPTTEFSSEDWNNILTSNLTGLFHCCRAAIVTMLPRGGGKIINVLSLASTNPMPEAAAYVAAKAGGLALTRSLQNEYRKQGIELTAFMPGSTATELWSNQSFKPDEKDMIAPEDVGKAIADILLSDSTGAFDEVSFMPKKGFL